MGMRTFRVEVQITIDEAADPFEVMETMDYVFRHDDIWDTEIVDAHIPDEA
jgi:hypothetical protein